MKIAVVLVLIARWLTASDDSAIKAAQQETRIARLETLELKEQMAVEAYNRIHAERVTLYTETCKIAGVDPAVCNIDPVAKTVTAKPAPAAKEK